MTALATQVFDGLIAAGAPEAQARAMAEATERVETKAKTDSDKLQTAMEAKADRTETAKLESAVNGKADRSETVRLETELKAKASQADLEKLRGQVASGADVAGVAEQVSGLEVKVEKVEADLTEVKATQKRQTEMLVQIQVELARLQARNNALFIVGTGSFLILFGWMVDFVMNR